MDNINWKELEKKIMKEWAKRFETELTTIEDYKESYICDSLSLIDYEKADLGPGKVIRVNNYPLPILKSFETPVVKPELTMTDLRRDCFPSNYTWYSRQPEKIEVQPHPAHDWRGKLAEVMPKRKEAEEN